jgi:hypothetical protein
MRARAVLLLLTLLACGQPRRAPATADEATADRAAAPTPRAAPDSIAAASSGIGLGFVLTSTAGDLDPAAVLAAYAKLAPTGPALLASPSEEPGILTFTLGDAVAAIATMPARIPGTEVEDGMQLSVTRLLSPWRLEYGAHYMVTALGPVELPPRERMRAFHRLLAAVAIAAGDRTRGIYVQGLTHEPGLYLESVRTYEDPTLVWFGVSVVREGDRMSVLSLGMPFVNLPDVLVTASLDRPGEVVGQVFDILSYLVARGKAIPAGETAGFTPDRGYPVRYVPSPINPKVEVMAIDLP